MSSSFLAAVASRAVLLEVLRLSRSEDMAASSAVLTSHMEKADTVRSSWPLPSLVSVEQLPGRGRGLVVTSAVAAGSPVLCEVALVSASMGGSGPWTAAAELALEVLRLGRAEDTNGLEPCAEASSEAQLSKLEGDEAGDVEDALELFFPSERRAARRLLHVVARNALALDGQQALCVRGAMINHSCTPNATHRGFRRASDGALCLCIRAVAPIAAGEEVTISYVSDLAAPHAERAAELRHHGFPPERRACERSPFAGR